MNLSLVSLFSGLGAFERALLHQGHQVELLNFCEIDPAAVRAYCTLHGVGEGLNLGNVRTAQVGHLAGKEVDLITCGFPCTDISISGKMEGILPGKTRSGLIYDAIRIFEQLRPACILIENVKNLVGVRFAAAFQDILGRITALGYHCDWAILNANAYLPQNRERVFILCQRLDRYQPLTLPAAAPPRPGGLYELLDAEVAASYYLHPREFQKLTLYPEKPLQPGMPRVYANIYARCGQNGNIYDPAGTSPTLRSGQGVVGHGIGSSNAPKVILDKAGQIYRRTTPRENLRLMGFDGADYDRLREAGISDTHIYKLAGNSVVVPVLDAIFAQVYG